MLPPILPLFLCNTFTIDLNLSTFKPPQKEFWLEEREREGEDVILFSGGNTDCYNSSFFSFSF